MCRRYSMFVPILMLLSAIHSSGFCRESAETSGTAIRQPQYILSDGGKTIGPVLGHTEIVLGIPARSGGFSGKNPPVSDVQDVTFFLAPGSAASHLWRWHQAARESEASGEVLRDLQIRVTDTAGKSILTYQLTGCVPQQWTINVAPEKMDKQGVAGFAESFQVRCRGIERISASPGSASGGGR